MILSHLSLQNFRSYKKSAFGFDLNTSVIVGPNTSGKSNIIEAFNLLATGKSFRADKDVEMIRFGEEIARVKGEVVSTDREKTELEIVLTSGEVEDKKTPLKKFLVNGVSRRRNDFISHLAAVLFSPSDLDMVVGQPSLRRRFLDDTLEQIDGEYRTALSQYTKALRQRNALLETARKTGKRNDKLFEYWDGLLISHGSIVAEKREQFIEFLNAAEKEVFSCAFIYDKSLISKDRLEQYKEAEAASGVTLVGPHRDDMLIHMFDNKRQTTHNVRFFGSRGQQRLVVLQLKILALLYMRQKLEEYPILLLDDIFSELDDTHIKVVLQMIGAKQTIITTTHEEFVKSRLNKINMIELKLT